MLLKDCDKNVEIALKKVKSLLDFLEIICEKSCESNQKTQVKNAKSMLKQIMDFQKVDSKNMDLKECFCLSQLAIKGDEVKWILQNHLNTLKKSKMQGREIGKILDFLLLSVIKGQIPNEQSALKEAIINYLKCKGA